MLVSPEKMLGKALLALILWFCCSPVVQSWAKGGREFSEMERIGSSLKGRTASAPASFLRGSFLELNPHTKPNLSPESGIRSYEPQCSDARRPWDLQVTSVCIRLGRAVSGLDLFPSTLWAATFGWSCSSCRRQRITRPCCLGPETILWSSAKSRNGQRRRYKAMVSKAGVVCQRCRVRLRSIHTRCKKKNASDLYLRMQVQPMQEKKILHQILWQSRPWPDV